MGGRRSGKGGTVSREELVERLLRREEAALGEAIGLYGPAVIGMARRVLGDPTLAEEVAQDAFVAFWHRPGAFDPARGNLKTFLCGVARNKAIDLVRKGEALKRTREALTEELEIATTIDLEHQIDERARVVAALKELTPAQREAIVLAYYGGRTYRAAAEELKVAEGTIKTRIREGMMKLRLLLDSAEGVGA